MSLKTTQQHSFGQSVPPSKETHTHRLYSACNTAEAWVSLRTTQQHSFGQSVPPSQPILERAHETARG